MRSSLPPPQSPPPPPPPLLLNVQGPPASGKTTLIPLILDGGQHAGTMTHVRPGQLFSDERAAGTSFGRQLDAFFAASGDPKAVPPCELILPFLADTLATIQDGGDSGGGREGGEGWLLEKGPRLVEHYQPWKEAGIVPDKVVILEVDPLVVVARTRGRLQDPVTGKSYVGPIHSCTLPGMTVVYHAPSLTARLCCPRPPPSFQAITWRATCRGVRRYGSDWSNGKTTWT